MKKKYFLTIKILLLVVSFSIQVIAQQPPKAKWTVLVFMNGDNNLEEDALRDFKEMARVGSTNDVNIVVQLDRHGGYEIQNNETNPKWTQVLRFRITKDMIAIPQNAIQDIGEKNMGDGDVLKDFVSWGLTKYPAEKVILIVWDHGQGYRGLIPDSITNRNLIKSAGATDTVTTRRAPTPAVVSTPVTPMPSGTSSAPSLVIGSDFRSPDGSPYRSVSHDETNGDELYNREIQEALASVLKGGKLDIIGFDACLMAMVETGYALRNIGRVMVGSQELEPGYGWQYDDWLKPLIENPSIDGVNLGKLLVDSYEKRYSTGIGFLEPDPNTTLSAVTLSNMDNTANLITHFSDRLIEKLDDELANIRAARNDCSNYAPNPYFEIPPRDYFYHIDFVRFSDRLIARTQDQELKNRAKAARDSVVSAVIRNYAGSARQGSFGSNGLAIYFPPSRTAYNTDSFARNGYEKANDFFPVEFVQKHTWADFLHAYFSRVQ